MNYRHAYHAGNFADVVKHAVLARVLTYMKLKPQPFRIIDTHAGAGRYDLRGSEAGKTNEWRDGIERIIDTDLTEGAGLLLAPYLEAVRSVNTRHALDAYPGSPLIARFLKRKDDHLIANELYGEDFAALARELGKEPGTNALNLDAWVALKSLLPPPERRGVVLIDPPFEKPDDFERLVSALGDAWKRFATGVYLIWYPVKDHAAANRFVQGVAGLGWRKILDVRLKVASPFAGLGLTETGLMIINPPFGLKAELEMLLPFLVDRLSEGRGAGFQLSEPGGSL